MTRFNTGDKVVVHAEVLSRHDRGDLYDIRLTRIDTRSVLHTVTVHRDQLSLYVPPEPDQPVDFLLDKLDRQWVRSNGNYNMYHADPDDDDEQEVLNWTHLWLHYGPLKAYQEIPI